jgi:crotonobetainyl-CoA:carnitine CoA-transferase CaiB-like acyl-CoA transferase
LDYESLCKYNPKLIYATASGWGPRGPEAAEGSFDYTGQAKAGFFCTGEEGLPPSYNYGGGPGDQIGGIVTAYGILGAVVARERFGIGQELDGSLLSGLMWLQGLGMAFVLLTGKELRHTPRSEAGNPLWNHYKCKDGKWIALAHLQPDRFWPNVCKALGVEHLQSDPRFAEMMERGKNSKELIAIFDGIFLTRTSSEWMEICRQNGVITAPVNTLSDLVDDEQVLANDFIVEFNHPAWGVIRLPANPVVYSKTPLAITREAPEFGQHTEEVLSEVLGMGWEEISWLKEQEVI